MGLLQTQLTSQSTGRLTVVHVFAKTKSAKTAPTYAPVFEALGIHHIFLCIRSSKLLAVLSPIIVALCSGLAFLAYKHPKGFSKINNALSLTILIAFAMYMSWCLGFQSGYYGADELKSYNEGIPLSMGYTMLIVFFVYIYLIILQNLPKILSEDTNVAQSEDENA